MPHLTRYLAAIVSIVIVGCSYEDVPIKGALKASDELAQVPTARSYVDFLPTDARDVHYYIQPRAQYFEARFPYTEEKFVRWAIDRGWHFDELQKSRNGARVLSYDALGTAREILEIQAGYWLSAAVQRPNGEVVNDVLILAFDLDKKEAHIRLYSEDFSTAARRVFRRGGLSLEDLDSSSWK